MDIRPAAAACREPRCGLQEGIKAVLKERGIGERRATTASRAVQGLSGKANILLFFFANSLFAKTSGGKSLEIASWKHGR